MNPDDKSAATLESAAPVTGLERPATPASNWTSLTWLILPIALTLVGLWLWRLRKPARSREEQLLTVLRNLEKSSSPNVERLAQSMQPFREELPWKTVFERVTTARFAPVQLTIDEWRGLLFEIRELVGSGEIG